MVNRWCSGSQFCALSEKIKTTSCPSIIQYELFKWVRRERDEASAYEVIALTQNSEIVNFDTSLALFAAEVSIDYRLAMADAIVYAAAILNNAKVITSDKHFSELSHIEYFAKKSK